MSLVGDGSSDSWIDPTNEDKRGTRLLAHILLALVLTIGIVFFLWANQAVLDEVTLGEGRVIPSSTVQVIQNLEGGIVSEILVREGQIVEANEVLLRVANSLSDAQVADLRQRRLAKFATIARLQAEISGVTSAAEIKFSEELLQIAPEVASEEMELFEARQLQLNSQISVFEDQVRQRETEINELNVRENSIQQQLGLALEELAITEPLAQQGIVSQVELIRLEREVADLRSQIDAVRSSRPRAEAALAEAQGRIEERRVTFSTEASQLLNEQRVEFASIDAQLNAAVDRSTRTEVTTPVRGTVKTIFIKTIGGVIQPGQDLVEVVPIEDTLLVEAQIRPSDIAFIRPQQPAVVKITAYDFSTYGGLDAVVEEISADTIQDERGEHFFRVRLRTDKAFLGTEANPLPIIPGMTASVDILTGHKTVLEYLLRPILRAKDTALRER
jgi:adhesin transport system membrane fusion protein